MFKLILSLNTSLSSSLFRLALVGGLDSKSFPTRIIFLFNEHNGWQQSHRMLRNPKSSHSSLVVNINAEKFVKLEQASEKQPNVVVAYGEPISVSESVCFSQSGEYSPFSYMCQSDRPMRLRDVRYGSVMVVNTTSKGKNKQTDSKNWLD